MNPARTLAAQYDLTESVIAPVLQAYGGDVRKAQKTLDEMKQPSQPVYRDEEESDMRKIMEDSKREAEEKENRQREEDELILKAIELSKKETDDKDRRRTQERAYQANYQAMAEQSSNADLQKKQQELKKKKEELLSFQAFLEEEKKREYARIEKEFEEKMAREEEERQKKWQREQEELEGQRRKFLEERTKSEERLREEEKRMQQAERLKQQEEEQRRREEELARKRKEYEDAERHRLLEEKEQLLREKEEQMAHELQLHVQAQADAAAAAAHPPHAHAAGLPEPEENRAPLVAIYGNPDKGNADVEACLKLLTEAGVESKDIKEMDFRNDYELQQWAGEKCGGKIVYPVVFVRGEVIAGLENLKKIVKEGKLPAYLDGSLSASRVVGDDPAALQLGILDKCLTGGEYLLSGVTTVLWLPVTILTWPFRKGQEAPKEFVDIPVVHCNWYWRHLERTFRFTETEFYRVHPRHNDIRAAHKYETVETIVFEGPQNIVIRYIDGSSPDYIRSTQTNISTIVKMITDKCPAIRVQN